MAFVGDDASAVGYTAEFHYFFSPGSSPKISLFILNITVVSCLYLLPIYVSSKLGPIDLNNTRVDQDRGVDLESVENQMLWWHVHAVALCHPSAETQRHDNGPGKCRYRIVIYNPMPL